METCVPRGTWSIPHGLLELPVGEIHLWLADLEPNRHALPLLEPRLAPEERAQAARFRFPLDRDRYILAHASLRAILGRYLTVPPEQLVFRYGHQGKPELASGGIHFSLSHSHDLVVCAIAASGPLGVDIELVRPGVAEALAGSLSPASRHMLDALPRPSRREAFFQGWTRMEAHAKAVGEGLGNGLESFHLFLDPSNSVLLPPPRSTDGPQRWWFHDFSPREGYCGALAAQQREGSLRYWQWQADEEPDSMYIDAGPIGLAKTTLPR